MSFATISNLKEEETETGKKFKKIILHYQLIPKVRKLIDLKNHVINLRSIVMKTYGIGKDDIVITDWTLEIHLEYDDPEDSQIKEVGKLFKKVIKGHLSKGGIDTNSLFVRDRTFHTLEELYGDLPEGGTVTFEKENAEDDKDE